MKKIEKLRRRERKAFEKFDKAAQCLRKTKAWHLEQKAMELFNVAHLIETYDPKKTDEIQSLILKIYREASEVLRTFTECKEANREYSKWHAAALKLEAAEKEEKAGAI